MKCVFKLAKRAEDLEDYNPGMTQTKWEQICPTRDVSGDNFSRGNIKYEVKYGGNKWWYPKYTKLVATLSFSQTRKDNEVLLPILSSSDLSPNMGLASHLFQSVEVGLNGTTLERIVDHVPQINAFKTRTTKRKEWLDSVGQGTNYWHHDPAHRKQQCAINGYVGDASPSTRVRNGIFVPLQALGFHPVLHKVAFAAATQILTFSTADGGGDAPPLDIQTNQVLRSGDLITLRGKTLEVVDVLTNLTALVRVVRGSNENVNSDTLQANEFRVQPIALSPSNDVSPKNTVEVVWQPPLGFFDIDHAVPPGGDWTFEFVPCGGRDWKKKLVESVLGDLQPSTVSGAGSEAGNFNVRVENMHMYVYTMQGERYDKGSYYLDFLNTKCQETHLPPNSTGIVQKSFAVHPNTGCLALAFQDQQAGEDTRYSNSKFKIRPSAEAPEGQDMLLKRFFIAYNGQTQPSPDFQGGYTYEPGFRESHTQAIANRYVDNLLQSGGSDGNGGSESLTDFKRRGPYHKFLWHKDYDEKPTHVTVNAQFSEPFGAGEQHRMLLFSQWKSAWKISHVNGKVDPTRVREVDT